MPSYDPSMFDVLDAVEDRHFWFRARGRIIGALARQAVAALPAGYRVLEIGCGNGGVLRVLRDACAGGKVFGMDLFAEGLRWAAGRSVGCPLVRGGAHRRPFGVPVAIS